MSASSSGLSVLIKGFNVGDDGEDRVLAAVLFMYVEERGQIKEIERREETTDDKKLRYLKTDIGS